LQTFWRNLSEDAGFRTVAAMSHRRTDRKQTFGGEDAAATVGSFHTHALAVATCSCLDEIPYTPNPGVYAPATEFYGMMSAWN
jgi:hypothetical protein